MKKILFILIGGFSLISAVIFPFLFLKNPLSGILSLKAKTLIESPFFINSFYLHVFLGAFALATGWIGFIEKIRNKYPLIHKVSGRVYVFSFLVTAIASIPAGLHAYGGWVSQTGFVSISVFAIIFTTLGFKSALNKNFYSHRKWMLYSYAFCFATVSLRIWSPLLFIVIKNELLAYNIVAWVSWLPNLLFVRFIILRKKSSWSTSF